MSASNLSASKKVSQVPPEPKPKPQKSGKGRGKITPPKTGGKYSKSDLVPETARYGLDAKLDEEPMKVAPSQTGSLSSIDPVVFYMEDPVESPTFANVDNWGGVADFLASGNDAEETLLFKEAAIGVDAKEDESDDLSDEEQLGSPFVSEDNAESAYDAFTQSTNLLSAVNDQDSTTFEQLENEKHLLLPMDLTETNVKNNEESEENSDIPVGSKTEEPTVPTPSSEKKRKQSEEESTSSVPTEHPQKKITLDPPISSPEPPFGIDPRTIKMNTFSCTRLNCYVWYREMLKLKQRRRGYLELYKNLNPLMVRHANAGTDSLINNYVAEAMPFKTAEEDKIKAQKELSEMLYDCMMDPYGVVIETENNEEEDIIDDAAKME